MTNVKKLRTKKKRKRFWIAEIFKKRKEYDFYHAILSIVRLEDYQFKNYTQLTTTI